MKKYITQFTAFCNESKEFKVFAGDEIEADSLEGAEEYCRESAPYLEVIGELVGVIIHNEPNEDNYNTSGQPNPFTSTMTENIYTVSIEDLQKQLKQALQDEDYESAADLRDEIEALNTNIDEQ